MKLGLSGWLTQATIRSPLTPLFLLAALAVGLIAILTIPREEDPQIRVPMVDSWSPPTGCKAADAAELVTKPLETILTAIPGVEHIYSQTQDDRVMVTARFVVGTNEDDAVLRVQRQDPRQHGPHPDRHSRAAGGRAAASTTSRRGADPVAEARGGRPLDAGDLDQLAQKLQAELVKIHDIGITYIAGSDPEEIRVEPDPEKLSLFGVTLQQLVAKVRDANRSFVAGQVRDAGVMRTVAAGQTLPACPISACCWSARATAARSMCAMSRGRGRAEPGGDPRLEHHPATDGAWQRAPAVSLALAKRAGANAVVMSPDDRRTAAMRCRARWCPPTSR